MAQRKKAWPCGVGTLLALALLVAAVRAEDELARRATWSQPTLGEAKDQVDQWLSGISLDETSRAKIEALWSADFTQRADSLLETVASTFAIVNQPAGRLVAICRSPRTAVSLPEAGLLDDEQTDKFLRDNLRLLYGRWLVEQQLYNEALEQLESLQPQDVVDPACLLFYKSVVYHRLLDKENGLASIARLMENDSSVPRRYVTVARLMEADLEPLKTDSLDEISRLMDSIRIRLGHGRAGRRVRKEEDDVVAKLEKLIKQLQQQAQQAQSAAGSGNLQPTQPMQDSRPGGGSGPGDVDPKRLADKNSWGNLPPKERQEALQQLGKDYPTHYRDVIEEYFRKLASDDAAEQP